MPHIRFSSNEFLHTNGRIISVSLHFFNGLSGSFYFVNNIQTIENFFPTKRFLIHLKMKATQAAFKLK